MITLADDLLQELMKSVFAIHHLIQLTLTSRVFYWTDSDQNIYYTNWWENHPIKYDNIVQSGDLEAGTLRLTVSNVDKTFSDLVQTESIQNKVCQIKRVFLDRNLDVIGTPTLIFYGYTDEIQINNKNAIINVADEMIKWKTEIPRRTHTGKCQWREFNNVTGGTECGYIGATTWCDRSYLKCSSMANTNNFGGFRFVAEMMDKEIWWGRERKSPMNTRRP